MSHEMDDLKHNDTFKQEHASLLAVDRGTILISAFGRKGIGKTTLLTALSLVLRAAGFSAKESTKRGGEHTLVVEHALAPTPLGRLCGLTQPHPTEPGQVEFRATERELQAAREEAVAWEGTAKRRNEACRALADERDAWKRVAERAGVCMTCALGAPEPIGCTDCLNSGWRDGAPEGFTPNNGFGEITTFPRDQGIKVVSDNGKRWRLQGQGWVMQPQGYVSADQAREICEMAFLAFAPQRRVTPEEDPVAHVRGDTVIDRPNPMIEAGRERAKRCSSEHCKDGYCMNWHAPHACYAKDDTVIDRPETLTEARLARLERFFTTEAGNCFAGPLYEPFNERVEAARKREA